MSGPDSTFPLLRCTEVSTAGVSGTVACSVFSFVEGVAWKAASAELDSRMAEVLSFIISSCRSSASALACACRARRRRLEVLFVVLVEGVVYVLLLVGVDGSDQFEFADSQHLHFIERRAFSIACHRIEKFVTKLISSSLD